MGDMKVFEAASSNNIEFLQDALAGAYGEQLPEDLELALIRAATNGHIDCVRLLLKHGVNVAGKNGADDTALITASQNGHLEIVRLLIEKGCPVDHQNSNGYTALMKACENGKFEVLELLLKHGATDISEDIEAEHAGVPNGVPKLPKYMPHGYSSLMVTVLKQPENYKDVLRILLASNFDVNAVDLQDMTVLHHAANKCPEDVICMLLEAKVNVDAKDVWGVTALMSAVAYGKVGNVKELLKCGADVSLSCKAKRTALSIAARTGSEEMIKTLLAAGADPNSRDAHDHPPLFIAILHNNYAGIKCMIQAGCDFDIVCRDLTSFQLMSCFQGVVHRKNVTMLRMLYHAGACNNHMLYEAATNEQLKQQSAEFPVFIEELNNLVSSPRSLKEATRMVIRKRIQQCQKLRQRFSELVDNLALPNSLRDYLLYSDITTGLEQ
ncbi:KDIS-like protein [Mya arenaria]|uniref:KDIS-like protein n=1 Tax=Mya arenaria TaxID=6604 RepID=A0ABY7DD89_MYAAR|nr:ankyrin repeat domain-containing protein 29-like [Mya arenaria]XP_052819513.1 ankyrin repeat domain-containing protein 29-like [Mya arenaria]WAQ95611.1 KDIS-like protein [Mya arenaria]